MKNAPRIAVVFAVSITAGACASQEPVTDCTLTAPELEQVSAEAMAFLLASSSAFDARCEKLSENTVFVGPGICAISGEPSGAAGCAKRSYAGYSIVFDRESLEPQQIFFKTE